MKSTPQHIAKKDGTRSSGLVQVYTGNGKGKTTAALGLAVRARSAGKRVAIIFFDKGGEHYSERKMLNQLGIDWFGYGLDRIDPKTERFRFGVISDDVTQAQEGIAKARDLLQRFLPLPSGGGARGGGGGPQPYYDLIILDEVNTAVALGMISERAVEELIDAKPTTTEIVLTGRTEVSKPNPSPSSRGGAGGGAELPGKPWPDGSARQRWLSYFDRADLVTEMKLVKHYFYQGTPAREGLDY